MAVIGSALTNLHSVAESVEILRPSDFYFPQNKEIFSVILDLFNENAAIDFITVSNKLSQSDKLEAVGGICLFEKCGNECADNKTRDVLFANN